MTVIITSISQDFNFHMTSFKQQRRDIFGKTP